MKNVNYLVKPGVIMEKIDNSCMLMAENNGEEAIYLTDISSEIFCMCEEGKNEEEITEEICNRYEIDLNTCRQDVEEFLNNLIELNIIEKK